MSAERKISARKLSMDMQRKLSAISNCSDVSNLSVMLGMEPNDFKSTIQNILGKKNNLSSKTKNKRRKKMRKKNESRKILKEK